jgi:hypothetical protein
MKTPYRKSLGLILAALLVFVGGLARGQTVELTITGLVRQPPPGQGQTLGGWPVGAYTDNRAIADTRLESGHANENGLYNLIAHNVPIDLLKCWILSDTKTGTSNPVPLDLPNPMHSPQPETADELIVNLRDIALRGGEPAVQYTSAVINDQSVRVFIGQFGNDREKALGIAKNNVLRRAGLVVTKEYERDPKKDLSHNDFWSKVWNREKEWSYPQGETLLEIVSSLTDALQQKTLSDPRPSSYSSYALLRMDGVGSRREARVWNSELGRRITVWESPPGVKFIKRMYPRAVGVILY